jgi:hypothetical protein
MSDTIPTSGQYSQPCCLKLARDCKQAKIRNAAKRRGDGSQKNAGDARWTGLKEIRQGAARILKVKIALQIAFAHSLAVGVLIQKWMYKQTTSFAEN